MEKLKQRLDSCQQALETLAEALEMPFSIIVRDGTIQRFEYSFESCWKLLKTYLHHQEGLVCNSPKSCFRAALSTNLLSEGEVRQFLAMTDDCNLTSHTYIKAVAETLYSKLPGYLALMETLVARLEAGLVGKLTA